MGVLGCWVFGRGFRRLGGPYIQSYGGQAPMFYNSPYPRNGPQPRGDPISPIGEPLEMPTPHRGLPTLHRDPR